MRSMVSREHKTGANYRKLQILRSISKSHAHSKSSIILDATNYIEELKQRLERIYQDLVLAQNSTSQNSFPPTVQLRVEALHKGFLIKVFNQRSCRGLLVFILEAFEKLRLHVLQARVSCSECFLLEAVAVKDDRGGSECLDADVKQAVSQAIQNWSSGEVIKEQY